MTDREPQTGETALPLSDEWFHWLVCRLPEMPHPRPEFAKCAEVAATVRAALATVPDTRPALDVGHEHTVACECLPIRVVVDQHGHYWRDYGDHWSMCPVSDEIVATDPVTEFYRMGEGGDFETSALREAAAAFVAHMDGPEPRHGLWAALNGDRAAIHAALKDEKPSRLDEAWTEVEAAVPEGWRLTLGRDEDDFETWSATIVSPAFFEGENDDDIEFARADTPAAALHALAQRLREHSDPGAAGEAGL